MAGATVTLKKAKRITITARSFYGSDDHLGYQINAYFGAYRTMIGDWSLTHLKTGYSVGYVKTFALAIRLTNALLRVTPAKHWDFTDPQTVTHNPTFAKCKAVQKRHKALR